MPRRNSDKNILPRDPDYRVDSLPIPIKAKITELENAICDLSWMGSQPPEHHASILEMVQTARYNLERTICTLLNRAAKEAAEEEEDEDEGFFLELVDDEEVDHG